MHTVTGDKALFLLGCGDIPDAGLLHTFCTAGLCVFASALAVQNVNLTQLRNDLFGFVASLRHIGPPPKSVTSGWANSIGEDQSARAAILSSLMLISAWKVSKSVAIFPPRITRSKSAINFTHRFRRSLLTYPRHYLPEKAPPVTQLFGICFERAKTSPYRQGNAVKTDRATL